MPDYVNTRDGSVRLSDNGLHAADGWVVVTREEADRVSEIDATLRVYDGERIVEAQGDARTERLAAAEADAAARRAKFAAATVAP